MLSVDKIHEHEIKTIVVYSYMYICVYLRTITAPHLLVKGDGEQMKFIYLQIEKKIPTIIKYDKTMPIIMYEHFNDPKIITSHLQQAITTKTHGTAKATCNYP